MERNLAPESVDLASVPRDCDPGFKSVIDRGAHLLNNINRVTPSAVTPDVEAKAFANLTSEPYLSVIASNDWVMECQ